MENQQTRKMKRENPTIEICPGITRRTVANGKTMYQMLATLAAGSRMPAHSHPQEQIVHILEGQMRLIVDGVPHELSTGDSFYLASNIPHGVETILTTRVIDTFGPRSQGQSTIITSSNTPEMRAQDLHNVLERLDARRPVLIGWSQGVQDLAAYVERYGTHDLAGLVLVDAAVADGVDGISARPEEVAAQF